MQSSDQTTSGIVADAPKDNWVDRFAPDFAKPYLRMGRFDRPIGFWLLFWPCAWSVGLAAIANPEAGFNYWHIVLMLIGAAVMRGAGCTFNDIVDRDIDDKVARTRSRPLPSGQVKTWQAAVSMLIMCLVGLVILIQFNSFSVWLGISSLVLVAIYPFMKRITYWPQLFLGLAFSWGALMGWASVNAGLALPPVIMYVASILWVIGYDTIYALQDIEDDALIGVKSTARLFGSKAREIISLFYAAAYVLLIISALLAGAGPIFVIVSLGMAAILAWEVITVDPSDWKGCLKRFKSNHWAGLVLLIAFWLEWRF